MRSKIDKEGGWYSLCAGHMRTVASFLLSKLKYRVIKAEWVTVFDL